MTGFDKVEFYQTQLRTFLPVRTEQPFLNASMMTIGLLWETILKLSPSVRDTGDLSEGGWYFTNNIARPACF